MLVGGWEDTLGLEVAVLPYLISLLCYTGVEDYSANISLASFLDR